MDGIARMIGTLMVRFIVPLWILTGAIFKLVERSPRNLPSRIVKFAIENDIDLNLLLRTLIGLELLAVAVMMFMPRAIARLMAAFMLVCFCAILVGEMTAGAASCGCLGKIPMKPWQMLAIDGTMLLLVLMFAFMPSRKTPAAGRDEMTAGKRMLATLGLIGIGFGVSFLVPDKTAEPAPSPENGSQAGAPEPDGGADGTADTPPPPPPPPDQTPAAITTYTPGSAGVPKTYMFDPENWEGKRWDELKIAGIMKNWPADVMTGQKYVVFFSRTCDHCKDMFENNFTGELVIPTTAVAIPEESWGFKTSGIQSMPCTSCVQMELPVGCFYVVTPPLVVALQDGVVQCAQTAQNVMDPECLPWPP